MTLNLRNNGPLKISFLSRAIALSILSTSFILTSASAEVSGAASPLITASPSVAAAAESAALATTAKSGLGLKGKKYELKLYHLHTGESLDVVYRVGNTYIPGAVAKLNYFLRDHRTDAVKHYDPKEFDLLQSLMTKLGKNGSVIDVVCGYRSPWSNEFLRTRSSDTGVAKKSQHMEARAIDIRVPGVSTSKLRNAALSLHGGGVGYYPVSQFVHVDVGPVRKWTYAGGGDD